MSKSTLLITTCLLVLLATIFVVGSQAAKTRTQTRQESTTATTVNTYNLTFIVSAKDLPAKSKTTKINPYVKISSRNSSTPAGTWTDLGKTDQLSGQLSETNIVWNNVFWFVWTKGTGQVLHFDVKDHHSISSDKTLGTVDLDLDNYVLKASQDSSTKFANVPTGKDFAVGTGLLRVQKTLPVKFRLYARMVPKMDSLNGLSDPFVECFWNYDKNITGDILFYKTKTIDNSENPDWDETIEFSNYQKGTKQWWHFKVWDSDPATSNDLIGEAHVEVDPFVEKRATKNNKLSTDAKNKAQLTLTPA